MADLAEYKKTLESIQQLYTIVLADYTARVNGLPPAYKPGELAKVLPNLGRAGVKLRQLFLFEAKNPQAITKAKEVEVGAIRKADILATVNAIQERADAELDLPKDQWEGKSLTHADGIKHYNTYLYYLAGHGVTEQNISTSEIQALIPAWRSTFVDDDNVIMAFALGTGDASLIARAKSYSPLLDILATLGKANIPNYIFTHQEFGWMVAYLAGYGITPEMVTKASHNLAEITMAPYTHKPTPDQPILVQVGLKFSQWTDGYQGYVDEYNSMLDAFIQGLRDSVK